MPLTYIAIQTYISPVAHVGYKFSYTFCLFVSATPCGSGKVILSPGGLTCHVARKRKQDLFAFGPAHNTNTVAGRRSGRTQQAAFYELFKMIIINCCSLLRQLGKRGERALIGVQSGHPYRLQYFFVSLCALLVKMFYLPSAQPASMQHCLLWPGQVRLLCHALRENVLLNFA